MLPQSLIPDRLRFRWRQFALRRRAAWWEAHSGEDRSFVFAVQPGVRMRLYLDSKLCELIYCRHFESVERAFLNAFLRPGDVYVDVGANIGLFALIAARIVGNEGRVLAFEPVPATFTRLLDNVRLNRFANVSCQAVALSDREGTLQITQSLDGFDAWNSLASPTMGSKLERRQIIATTWDRFAEESGLSGGVTMMKIDVEGWEARVLAGARRALSRPDAPVLQVEFTDGAAAAAGGSCAELYTALELLGYRMFLFDAGGRRLVRDPVRAEYPNANLFAVKDAERVNRRLQGGD